MTILETQLAELGRRLDAMETGWCLVGGLAVSTHVEPRLTRDVDVAVSVADDAGAEAVVRTLVAGGYRPLTLIEHETAERLATVRLRPPGGAAGGVVVDLLFASSGIETEVVAQAQPIEVSPGLTAPVASLGHLLALKILSRDDRHRPQDIHDIRRMLDRASEDDIASARGALTLIEARGYQRGRPLGAALDGLLAS